MGCVFRFLFFAFNVLMLIWLLQYWTTLGDAGGSTGATIGGAIGTLMLLLIRAAGALALLMLATRDTAAPRLPSRRRPFGRVATGDRPSPAGPARMVRAAVRWPLSNALADAI
jgi:hypothetical protein